MPVTGTTEEEPARWDDPRLSWDMPGLVWDGPVPESARNPIKNMASSKTKPMNPATLQEDEDAVVTILAMPEYTSVNPEFDKDKMYHKAADGTETGIRVRLEAARERRLLAKQAYDEARDEEVALEWIFHDWTQGAREQIAAHYGKNSDEYAATGRKKPVEYKKTGRRPAAKKAGGS